MLGMPDKSESRSRSRKRGRSASDGAEDVLTIDELAAYLKLAKSTAYKLAQEGKIPGQKVGRHWRFHRVAIDRWLGDHRGEGLRP